MTKITVELIQTFDIEIENNWTYKILLNHLCYYFNCKETEIIINDNNYNINDIIDLSKLNILIKIEKI